MSDAALRPAGPSRVVVAVVTHDSEPVIDTCLASLERAALEFAAARVVVIDNASRDGTVERVRARFPWVSLRVNDRNLGFAGGANLALDEAESESSEFVYLLNPDTEVEPRFLEHALAAAADPRVAAVQSLLLLPPDGARIDSAGNAIHVLGFGYCRSHGRSRSAAPRSVEEIPFASGAGVLLRLAALHEAGRFDESLFLYCEDLDLGWRLRRAGWLSVVAPESIVVHAHEFARHADKEYLLERNRWRVLLANWSARSLAVLALPLLVNEVAMLAIAAKDGWLGSKLRALASAFDRSSWSAIGAARRRSRALRRVSDRELARWMSPRIELDGGETPLLRRLANPAVTAIWSVARRLL